MRPNYSENKSTLDEPLVLADDARWLVVYKPADWHSVKGGKRSSGSLVTLEDWITSEYPTQASLPEGGIVHRLDLETTGCLLVAKDKEIFSDLRERFLGKGDPIEKTYLCEVKGKAHGAGRFDLFFRSRYKRSKKISIVQNGKANERGRCEWKVLDTHHQRSLMEVKLIGPGRRHQIRAGFAHLGHPLTGDNLYGGAPSKYGLKLHAWKLKWDDNSVEAPPPFA